MVNQFVHDVYALVDRHPEWELNHYGQILEENGLRWDSRSMSGAIVLALASSISMAKLMAISLMNCAVTGASFVMKARC